MIRAKGEDVHGRDVLPRERIRCVRDQKTCLKWTNNPVNLSITVGAEGGLQIRELLTLPTAPSPVTTHCSLQLVACPCGKVRESMAYLQRLSSRACRHGESMYTEKENDKGGS